MTFKPLEISDRKIFLQNEKNIPLQTSDANFTNMFIWNSYYNFSWARHAGFLCLLAEPENKDAFAFPPLGQGDTLAAVDFLFSALEKKNAPPVMSRVPESLAFELEKKFNFQIEHDPDNDDYIYLSEKLINLSGRRMHQKKNHYNYFMNNYNYECLEITPDLLNDLMAVQEIWLSNKEDEGALNFNQIQYELDSVHKLLQNMEVLEQKGMAIKVDGVIEAFTLGEELNGDTALIHLEKANPNIRGLFVALCSNFCRRYFSHLTYINREQDLGLPGLRQSKESLKPDHMCHKYSVRPNVPREAAPPPLVA